MQTVGVVGSGTMATGIIEVVAKGGYEVRFVARAPEKVEAVTKALTKSLDKAVVRGKLDEAGRDAVLARVSGTTSLDDLADRDLVIEAVVESLSVKEALFAALGEIAKPGAVLATTTSSLPVIECAKASGRPADVVGMHFFNPAQVMKLVEVVSTISTAPDVAATAHAVSAKLGKHAVSCTDRAGLHRQRAAVPVPQRRGEDARGALRDRRRHRRGDEGRLRLPDGARSSCSTSSASTSPWPSRGSSTSSSASPASRRPRCWSTW